MRKRVFAAAYRIDKSIATFLGRPPRLSARHSDCGLPLCIDDQIYGASNDVFNQAMDNVDAQGWSLKPTFQPVAWLRLRCCNARFREEILDMSLMPSSPKMGEQLKFVHKFPNPKIYKFTYKAKGIFRTAAKRAGNHIHRTSALRRTCGPTTTMC